MHHREWVAPRPLRTHVACLWAGAPRTALVLPDGCVDLVWTGRSLVVAGPSTQAFRPSVAPDADVAGVRFKVGAAGSVLGIPARELRNRSPHLADLWPEGAEIEERCGSSGTATERLRLLSQALVTRVRDAPAPSPLLRRGAVALNDTRARVERLDIGLSARQLRRMFDDAVGVSPKALARILRLQRALRTATGTGDLAAVAVSAGYADQAHLSRECRELTGMTPRELRGVGAAAAGDPTLNGGAHLLRR